MPEVDVKIKTGMDVQTEGVEQKVKNTAKKAGESAVKQMNKADKKVTFGAKMKDNLEKVKVGIQNIGIGGDKLSKLGDLFKGGGWIAVAAMAVTALAKGAMALWDKMTTSAEQLIQKSQILSKNAQQNLNQVFTDESSAKGYFERLKQLNAMEERSNVEKMQAVAIIQNLTKTYGDLGLSVSAVTGKVLGLDEALEKVEKRNRQKKIIEAEKVVSNKKNEVKGNMEKLMKQWIGEWYDIFNEKSFTDFGQFQKGRSDIFAKGIDVKLNEDYVMQRKYTGAGFGGRPQYHWEKRQLTAQQKKQAQLWNNGGLQGKIQYLENKLSKSTTKDQIQALNKMIAVLKELQKAQKQLQNIKKTGFKNTDDYLKKLKQQNQQTRKLKDGVKKQAEQYLKSRKAKEQAQFYAELKPTSTKVAYQQVKLQVQKQELKPLQDKEIKIKTQLQFAEKELEKALKTEDPQKIEKAYKRVNELIKQSAQAEKAVLDKQEKIRNIQAEINKLNKLQNQENLKKLKTDEQRIKKLRQQLQIEKKKQKQSLDKKSKAESAEKDQQQKKVQVETDLQSAKKSRADILKQLGNIAFPLQFEYQEQIKKLKKDLEQAIKNKDFQKYEKTKKQLKSVEKKYADNSKNTKQGWFVGAQPLPSFMPNASKDQRIEEWKKKIKQALQLQKKIKELQKKRSSISDSSSTAEKQKLKYEQQALQAKMKQLQIQAEIKAMEDKAKEYYSKQNESLQQQLSVEKLILQGKYEQAEKQKLINSLKQQGLIVDQKEISAILQKKKALAGLNVDRSIKQQGQSLLDKVGANDRNYQYQKRIRDLEQANKTTLSKEQKDKVKLIMDLQFDYSKLEKIKPNFSDLQIKTNQLTARGGFAGGAVAPDVDLVNKQIRDYQAKSANTLIQIKQLLQKGGVI